MSYQDFLKGNKWTTILSYNLNNLQAGGNPQLPNTTLPASIQSNVNKTSKTSNSSNRLNELNELNELTFRLSNSAVLHKCIYCNASPCVNFDKKGRPVCENCYAPEEDLVDG